MPNGDFSARWVGSFMFDAGNYQFTAAANDGVRLWIDGQLEIDQWQDTFLTRTTSVTVPLTAGDHTVKVEYYDHNWAASVSVSWKPVSGAS